MNRKRLEKEKTKNQKQKEEKQNIAHRNSGKQNGEPKVIELNLSATVAVIIAIIVLIVTVTSVKVITTIIVADENKKLNNDTQAANERVTYVNSTLKDESGKMVNETDADGNVIQVPVPKGYSASKIEGETTASKGFVIYEGDVDWSTILVDDETNNDTEVNTNSSDNIKDEKNDIPLDEPAFEDDLVVINENIPEDDTNQDEDVEENVEINKNVVKEENIDIAEEEGASDETTEGDDTTDETPEQTVTQQEINIFNLQKTRNQYVWVPVKDPSRIYGVDSNGKLWGKLYKFSDSGRTALNWSEINGIMNITSKTSYRDPNVVQSATYDCDGYSYMHRYGLGETRYEMLTQELEQNYYEIIESIKKYGGFYIGRYETGGLNGTAVVRKMDSNICWENWYTMYKRCLTLKGKNTYVKTSMIFGSLWNETLEWLINVGATISNGTTLTYQLMNNSTTWGNHFNSEFNYIVSKAETPILTETKELYKRIRIPAGSAEYTKVNNIYDIAGNVLDWTTEVWSIDKRICYGGNYEYSGGNGPYSNFSASSRYDIELDCVGREYIRLP